ncbi:MAG TPA: CHAT domain-containing tetratricopeptide repeat protein [Bryobacterales bacterium]|nr:CHAT domain-containing tetratricopeptide repeat protein [Bryobacterales bacterium]
MEWKSEIRSRKYCWILVAVSFLFSQFFLKNHLYFAKAQTASGAAAPFAQAAEGVRGVGVGGETAQAESGRSSNTGAALAPWSEQAALAAFRAGRYREALGAYGAAFDNAGREGAPAAVKGRLLRGAGACRLMLSDYRGALEDFSRARPYATAGGDRKELAALDADIASTYLYQDDPDNAARIYRRALGWLADAPRSPYRAAILANLAVVDLREKRYARAMESLGPALEAAQSNGDRRVEASAYEMLGLARLGLRNYGQAKEWFERSLAVWRSLGDGAGANRLITWLGRTELEAGHPAAAVVMLNQSVARAEQRESRTDLRKALYFRGRAHQALGEWEPATEDLRRAVEILESIRWDLAPRDAFRVAYEVSHHEIYDALAGLLCEQGKAEEAFHAVEQGRAQSLRMLIESRGGEEAARRELEARFAPPLELREAQAKVLDGETLLLDYYAGAQATYLWAVTDTEMRFYRLPPASEWREEIRRFRAALQTPAGDSAGLGRRLYRSLLGAVDPSLLERRRWIIAADDDLVLLPFCALPGPERPGRHYLIERHSLDYTPSVSVLYSLRQAAARRYDYDFLGVADPVVNRADPRWRAAPAVTGTTGRLPRLVSSGAEIESCARLFGERRAAVLTGFAVSQSELRRQAAHSYRYWHFSSHVVADAERPNRSFLALSIPPEGPGMEKLTVLDVLGLPVRAEMVLLNGCDSGAGKNLPGSGVLGLTRAFLAAGARSVCATRWNMLDEGGALVTRFYERLPRGGAWPGGADRATALRDAQVEMIRAGDWRSEPRYWAAYFLVGSAGSPMAGRPGTEHAQRR